MSNEITLAFLSMVQTIWRCSFGIIAIIYAPRILKSIKQFKCKLFKIECRESVGGAI